MAGEKNRVTVSSRIKTTNDMLIWRDGEDGEVAVTFRDGISLWFSREAFESFYRSVDAFQKASELDQVEGLEWPKVSPPEGIFPQGTEWT